MSSNFSAISKTNDSEMIGRILLKW